MRFASLAVVLVLVLSVCALAATPTNVIPEKISVASGVNVPSGRVGGETIATATVIPALPFTDMGNTCVFVNDYDETCPYSGGTAPDCVYSFTPAVDMHVDVFLCMSAYDTKVYMYENVYTPGAPFACNDDADCSAFTPDSYRSWIADAALIGGNTYYIVVDGYGTDCGDYILDVYEVEECVVECPPEALAEGEVDCYAGYDDIFNSGCNGSTAQNYSVVDCSNETIVICGTTGVFEFVPGSLYRDTDWYMLTLDVPATITIGGESEAGLLMGFVDMSTGCAGAAFLSSITAPKCTYTTLSYTLPAGESVVFVSTDVWDPGYVCGSTYYLTIDGYECTSPVEEKTWGSIKSLYR